MFYLAFVFSALLPLGALEAKAQLEMKLAEHTDTAIISSSSAHSQDLCFPQHEGPTLPISHLAPLCRLWVSADTTAGSLWLAVWLGVSWCKLFVLALETLISNQLKLNYYESDKGKEAQFKTVQIGT